MFVPSKTSGATTVAGTGGSGITIVPQPTPLTRLHYFDGKYLRAEHLTREQDYLRTLVHLANLAGGTGVVHGYDTVLLTGTALQLGPGLAMDPQGRPLLLPTAVRVDLAELLEKAGRPTRPATPAKPVKPALVPSRGLVAASALAVAIDPGAARVPAAGEFQHCEPAEEPEPGAANGCELWLLTIAHAERYCGFEDVFGKLCEEACITSQDRPWIEEGIVVRLRPLSLTAPLPSSGAFPLGNLHLRSRVASAVFRDEALQVGSWISGAGLRIQGWCLGAHLEGGADVPLAVVGLAGTTVCFLDAWTARRERIDTPPRRYWAWRMAMRPWDVFLAHVLQFQCQLAEILLGGGDGGPTDPCEDEHQAIREASETITHLERLFVGLRDRTELRTLSTRGGELFEVFGGLTRVTDLKNRLFELTKKGVVAKDQVLLRGGIVELPSAGYLPVIASASISVNRQVRTLLGDGVDLRYCVVRPDYVAHALEEAQHMERISLLHGLDHPEDRPKVDILVPDGVITKSVTTPEGTGFDATVSLSEPERGSLTARGAARAERLATGGAAFHFAGVGNAKRATANTPAVAAGTLASSLKDEHLEALGVLTTDARKFLLARDVLRTQPVLGEIARAAIERRLAVTIGAEWLSIRCERNPLELGFAEATTIRGRLAIQQPTQPETLYDLDASAELRVTGVQQAGDVRRVEGLLLLSLTGRVRVSGSREEQVGERIRLRTEIEYASRGSTPSVRVTFSKPDEKVGDRAVFQAVWGDNPLTIDVTGTYVAVDAKPFPFLIAKLGESPDALRVGSALYNMSISALDLLAAALDEPLFRETGKQLLFPPVALPSEETTVRATRDWVLFHRRRDKNCGVPAEAPPSLPPARYRVWHVDERRVDGGSGFVWEALKSGDPQALQHVRRAAAPVADVMFDGGLPTLQSSEASFRQDWANVPPGDRMILGVVATRGQHDDTVEVPRLARLESVVASLTPPAAGHELRRLDEPSALFAPAGTDGYVILVTNVREAPTTCHEVYRFAFPRNLSDILASLIKDGDVTGLLGLPKPDGSGVLAQLLGRPEWERDTAAQILPFPDLTQAWIKAGDDTPVRVITFAKKADPRLGPPELHTQRSQQIASLLGLSNPQFREELPTAQNVEPCPAVTIGFVELKPVRTAARVVLMRGGEIIRPEQLLHLTGDLQIEFADDAVLENARSFPQIAASLNALPNLRFARLEITGPPEAAGRGSRAARVQSLLASAWRPSLPPASGASANGSLSPQSPMLTTPTQVDEVVILHIS